MALTAPEAALLLALGGGLGMALGRRAARRGPAGDGPSRTQLLDWIGGAPQGWLTLDPQLTIRSLNRRAERLLALPAEAMLVGRPIGDGLALPELEALVRNAQVQQCSQRQDWQQGEETLEAWALPGQRGWVALLLQPRRSLDRQIAQQERWVSDVAHELKTPLTALLLVGDSLASHADGHNAVLVGRLQRELRRLQQLVGDLLELSRLENALPALPFPPSAARLDLRELVEAAWTSLRPLAEQRAVTLQLSGPGQAPVQGERSRLHRALLNLLDNAVRFSPDGRAVEVTIEASGRWWWLRVRDHGCGLSGEDQERMFERFYRGDPARARWAQAGGGCTGTGLGLAIVQQIALTHGGRVQGRNHPEGGAVMELLLPRGI